jgi:ubiquinone/menaquinone biosynthesis C-methylase UbiE
MTEPETSDGAERSGSGRGATAANIARQRRFWNRRALTWDHGAEQNPGLVKVVERVLGEAAPQPTMQAIDLGCGSGQVTLKLAPKVAHVLAIDISAQMIDLLARHAADAGIDNVSGTAAAIESLDVEPSSVDLICSNYALHHLRDADKRVVVERCATWLRPGGRLVIGDMMFGRGGDPRDRVIIASKLSLMLRKGPAGWYRIAKNATRYLLRYQERPLAMSAWVRLLEEAGFTHVVAIPVVNEAAVVRGERAAS